MLKYEIRYEDGLFIIVDKEHVFEQVMYKHNDIKEISKYMLWTSLTEKVDLTHQEENLMNQLGDTIEYSM